MSTTAQSAAPVVWPVPAGGQLAPGELATWLEASNAPRVLDVRSPAEFETVHIPASYNVPLGTLREHRDELAQHLDDHVVLVCRSGMRAQQAERALGDVGLSHIHVLKGGVSAWQAEGGDVKQGEARWDLERQVRFVAGLLVLLAVLVSFVWPPARVVAGLVGAGLVFAAVTNTCGMAMLLSRLPYNRPRGTAATA